MAPSLEHDLFQHVRSVLARSERLARRSVIVTNASRHARSAETLLANCAWCGRLRLGEEWVRGEEVPRFLRLDGLGRRLTHGICPECFQGVQQEAGARRALPPTAVVIRTDGPLAMECLTRALVGYS